MQRTVSFFSKKRLALAIFILIWGHKAAYATDIQFNTDILDADDKKNIDISVFDRAGYIMPGKYTMGIILNGKKIKDADVVFFPDPNDEKNTIPCLTEDLVDQFALTEKHLKQLSWYDEKEGRGTCLILPVKSGWTFKPDLASQSLTITIPQAWLEYVAENWDPPSRWDDGIPGVIFDYNGNVNTTKSNHAADRNSMSANGTAGFNLGPWRARADWQSRIDNEHSAGQRKFDWTRYYLFRPIRSLRSRLSIGEDYLYSDLFDSFRFSSVTLRSDDNMLPPNLRGYAPQVTGVAKTNARVTVSQQGAVIYQTQVAPGPFVIQDLNDAVNGELDVKVEEQDGTTQQFTIQTSSIPYLTRPGALRYKISAGKPSDIRHHTQGPMFSMGEFSLGVSNGWSLYGGGTANNDYQAGALGVGRDLMVFGAVSFDTTHSRAKLPGNETVQGNSYRVSYSKRFDEYNSQVTFAGYRFSERNYLSMADYLSIKESQSRLQNMKEMYTISFNKQFTEIGASVYLDYNHKTYWSEKSENRYNLSMSKYFDFYKLKNLNFSLNAYRSKYNGLKDDGAYFTLSVPWSGGGTISYNGSRYKGGSSNQVSYFDSLNDRSSYQMSVGKDSARKSASGFYSYDGDLTRVDTNASYQEGMYKSAGLGLQGGITATTKGIALHRVNRMGGSRVLIDTDDVSNVPMRGYGSTVRSNYFGKAVIADISDYYRNELTVDVNKVPDDVEVVNSVEQVTLTEGAIGYRRFNVIQGDKGLVYIKLKDGSSPPFGASVINAQDREVGIVNDDGSAYLSGIKADEVMRIKWGGELQCQITFPKVISEKALQSMLLPCASISNS